MLAELSSFYPLGNKAFENMLINVVSLQTLTHNLITAHDFYSHAAVHAGN